MAGVYVALTNIPSHFHAADLRAHFSSFVEEASFNCFHFRHRPEKQTENIDTENSKETVKQSGKGTKKSDSHYENESVRNCSSQSHKNKSRSRSRSIHKTTCCIITVVNSRCHEFIKRYNEQQWTDVDGHYLGNLCHLSIIKLKKHDQVQDGESVIISRDREHAVDETDLLSMPELKPPEMMPNGNVGTPTLIFLDFIQKCLLPNSIINKLQLSFPSTNAKRLYSNVNFNYNSSHSEPFSQSQRTVGANQKVSDEPSPYCASQGMHSFESKSNSPCRTLQASLDSHSSMYSSHVAQTDYSLAENLPAKDLSFKASLEVSEKDNLSSVISTSASSTHVVSPSLSERTGLKPAPSGVAVTQKADDLESALAAEKRPPTRRERKQMEKEERRRRKALMDEGIEERLIRTERQYLNDDDAEEWDRHEATENDPSNQERNKERLYEEEIEQPWEKGGPGVVFYTDAIYWQAKEGDFDEQTTDDLDVDFSPYEGDGPGDQDIQDFLKIRQEKRFQDGYDQTDRFSIGLSKRPEFRTPKSPAISSFPRSKIKRPVTIGQFECHTKGIGRRLMEKQGWQDGQGLGASGSGMKEALRGEGQVPKIKKGLGYVEQEPVTYGPSMLKNARVHRPPVRHFITTSTDNPQISDPKEPLLQRDEPTRLKYRQAFLDRHAS